MLDSIHDAKLESALRAAAPRSWLQPVGADVRFRREAAAAKPVAFGSRRKPEAILIPNEGYELHQALARQRTLTG